MSVSRDDLLAWITSLQAVYNANKEYLTELDSAIGDADHGINMNRGFTTALSELQKTEPDTPNNLLKTVAMSLIRTVGGASGPLYGTFFMRASAAVSNKTDLDNHDLIAMFEAGVEGIKQRGKAELEDKTMIDAWMPALNAMQAAAERGASIAEMMAQATAAAQQGMESTTPLQARKGRASYLGERSIGHQDPGATSTHMMLKAAAEIWS